MEVRTINNTLFFAEVAEQLALGHAVRMRARGNSMLPFIRDGRDVLVLEKPGKDSFRRGRLVLARLLLARSEEDRYVIHRVVKVQGDRLWLRGDGNLKVYERCSRAEVLAEVTEVVRSGRRPSVERSIRQGSWRWNAYRFWGPAHPFLRSVGLALYRRLNKK